MERELLGLIFIIVWLAVVFLYCIFRSCGGRIVDIFSCDCFAGPLFDCWGIGGRIDRYDRDYPFRDGYHHYFDGGYGPYAQPPSQLPPIVVVNSMPDRESRKRDESDRYTDDDDDEERGSSARRGKSRRKSRDPELREEAGGALLLRSSGTDGDTTERNEPSVV